jgi:tetratricopeptide (TPR) repeat protein
MLPLKTFLIISLCIVAFAVRAQTTDTALYNKLGDFDLARLYHDNGKALSIGEEILPDTAKLTSKAKVSFFGRLAKVYEDGEQSKKAIIYYQKVIAVVPDYYVAQRALGYLADSAAEEIHRKLYRLKQNDPSYKTLFDQYKEEVLRALPHLEKGQACDPNDDDLDMIRTLYQNIHDDQGLKSLNERLAALSKNCIDILSDN